MLVVRTVAKFRRAHFVEGKSIKQICRDLRVSRNTVSKVRDLVLYYFDSGSGFAVGSLDAQIEGSRRLSRTKRTDHSSDR